MAIDIESLQSDRLRRYENLRGTAFEVMLLAATLVGIVSLAVLLGYVLVDALAVFKPEPAWINWGLLTGTPSRFPDQAGIYPQIVGSVLVVGVMAVLTFPVGVAAAIYLEEYAPNNRFRRLIQVNISNLAGVPSVVYGLLGLALFLKTFDMDRGLVIAAGVTLGLLILPIVIVSAQEALRSVPDSRREASYGMGASRWQTVRNVVLPEALPGILTGTILALGRAIGETAPLVMIGVATTVFSPPTGLFDKATALPLQIFAWASFPQPDFRFGVVAASVVVLLGLLILLNGTAIFIRYRYQRGE